MTPKLKNVFRSGKSKPPAHASPESSQRNSLHAIAPADQPAEPSLTNTYALLPSDNSHPSSVPIREGHNYGIKELYSGGAHASIDIVFVHGLTGNTYTTWLHKDSCVHWPGDLLKEDIPDARILGFGYDADIVKLWNPASNSRLSNHAENMVGALVRKRERTETEKRRILFVAHSLGGLVVEKALTHSRGAVEKALRQVEQYTAGVVFIGVPHCGADLAAWASMGTRMVNLIRHANEAIVEVLRPGSEMLREMEKGFRSILSLRRDEGSEIFVTCFFEELPVLGIGEIVPLHSAEMKPYGCYGIHANHMDMTKFPDRDDHGYDAILGELQRWKKSIDRRASSVVTTSMGTTSDTDHNRYPNHFGDTHALNSQVFQGTFHNANISQSF